MQILAALKCDRALGESRRAPRVGLRARAAIQRWDELGRREPAVVVWVRNISASGVGLLHDKPLTPAENITLRLPSDDGGACLSIDCQIVHCHPMGGGHYRVGAKFVSEPYKEMTQNVEEPVVLEQLKSVIKV
ncbi:MAG: PilZ domain-containing protein [Tepidisphaeraceae bacterium]